MLDLYLYVVSDLLIGFWKALLQKGGEKVSWGEVTKVKNPKNKKKFFIF